MGKGLIFYYHAYHQLSATLNTGNLSVMARDISNGTEVRKALFKAIPKKNS